MGLPALGMQVMPMEIIDDDEEPPGKKVKGAVALPRCSPRFPHHSTRILALSRAL